MSKQQLRMVWPKELLDQPPKVEVAEGYRLRTYRPGDEASFFHVMSLAGFERWDMEQLLPWLKKILPEGWFLVEHVASEEIVATAMAVHNPSQYYPFGGELGWVAAHPDHTGKRLGKAVCDAVVARFLSAGYTNIYLNTDDARLPAVKTYLNMGFRPVIVTADMSARWEAICEALEWPYRPETWRAL